MARPVRTFGEPQPAKPPASSLHSKVDPDSLELNSKAAAFSVIVPLGPESIVVSGAVMSRSTVKVRVAGEASTLPAPSVARTEKVWEPLARPLRDFGEVQPLKAAPSSLHSKVDPDSLELKAKAAEAVVIVEPSPGPESMVVWGGVVSRSTV